MINNSTHKVNANGAKSRSLLSSNIATPPFQAERLLTITLLLRATRRMVPPNSLPPAL
jgi:hypothetical protein